MLATRAALDRARHDVSRGPDMLTEVEAADGAVARVGVAAAAAKGATENSHAQASPEGPSPSRETVGRAEAVLAAAAARALEGAAAATQELTHLRRLAQADQAMDAVVSGWDAPGSATERRAALSAAAADLDRLAAELAAAPAVPPGCPGLRDHRVAWASLLAARSRELASAATSATGSTYDRLRASYGAAPYGLDRLAADASDRPCWESASAVTASVADVRSAVADVQAALSPPT